MHFQNGNSTIKMSYILRVQATLYEEYKGGYMSKMRCISRYAVKIAVIVFIAILSTGCRSDDRKELELKEATVQEETTNPEKKSDKESGEKFPDDGNEEIENEEARKEKAEPQEVYIHVCGHVKQPGVYKLQSDSRVYEAIEAAGGMTETAAFSYLNQAELLQDGEQIYIPSQEEVESGKVSPEGGISDEEQKGSNSGADSSEGISSDGKVNLNTATKDELMTLSGVGDVRAQAILKYREEHGEFRSIEELMEVEGIKKGTFQKLKDQIKI